MYESLFGFRERPFSAAPVASAYFPAESIASARQQASRCVERAEGIAVVVGGAGCGKSLLLRLLAEEFRDRFHVALLAGAAVCTRRALLQNILFELKLPYRGLEEGELRLALMDHLQPSRECPQGMLLLIDEAHTLPQRLLEEVRLLTNLVREGSSRVRLVIAGAPSLEERLASPKMESFTQRIAMRAYLHGLTSSETADYVRQEVARCGGKINSLLTTEALRAVHTATAGIPRLVNQVCDHAFTWAAAHRLSRIDASTVQDAWSDLQQLPLPCQTVSSTSSIEFGALDDQPGSLLDDAHVVDVMSRPTVSPSIETLFGEDFLEEEVVVDRCAELDAKGVGGKAPDLARPALRVVDAPLEATEQAGPLSRQVDKARQRSSISSVVNETEQAFDPALDPVYPESDVASAKTAVRVIAIDAAHEPAKSHSRGRASSRFRHLFSSLRGKNA